jgi:hypothetical protein
MKILLLSLESDLAIAALTNSAAAETPARCIPPSGPIGQGQRAYSAMRAQEDASHLVIGTVWVPGPLNIRACLVPAMPASAACSVTTVLSQVSGQT